MSVDPDLRNNAINCGRLSLASYAVAVDQTFLIPEHVDYIIQALEAVEAGEIRRLMIFMPPRHGKTQIVSRIFPSWFIGRDPTRKVLAAGHTHAFAAAEFGYHVYENVNSSVHAEIFPEFKLSQIARGKSNFKTTKHGGYYCAGVDAGFTGRGAHCFLIDDPIKTAQDAYSVVKRKALKEWYDAVARTRLEPKAAIIIVQTRWHEDDLSGWLLNPMERPKVDNWYVLSLPAIAETDEGWRQEGEALWPARYPIEELEDIKIQSGQWVWAAMYQQAPSAVEGMMVLRKWFRDYAWNPHLAAARNLVNIMTQPYHIYQSWDSALEEGQENDYSVCETYLETGGNVYLLDVFRKKVISTELFRLAKELAIYWKADAVLIEDTTASKAFCQQMETTDLPIIRIKPEGDKRVRLQAVSYIIEACRFFVPHNIEWRPIFINEICAFPTAAHDDQVDAMTQFLHWWSMRLLRKKKAQEAEEAAREGEYTPYDI